MNKKIIPVTFLLIIIIVIFLILLSSRIFMPLNNVKSEENIAYMYEQENGDYVLGKEPDWSQINDYILNSDLSKCSNNAPLSWDKENNTIILKTEKFATCKIYLRKKFYGESCNDDSIACKISQKVEDNSVTNDNGLIFHDGAIDVNNDNNIDDAGDYSYRYSGGNPQNYICFGKGSENYNNGTDDSCPTQNKYRIIGIIPTETKDNGTQMLVKVIKAEFATADELGIAKVANVTYNSAGIVNRHIENEYTKLDSFDWSSDKKNNTWEDSPLYKALNDKFLNTTLGSGWNDKIEEVKWNAGGAKWYALATSKPSVAHTAEINGTGKDAQVNAKIGLMYAHDYAFASSKENWFKTLYCSKENDTTCYWGSGNKNNNWIFNHLCEWTISRYYDNKTDDAAYSAFGIYEKGYFGTASAVTTQFRFGVRPVFYLKSNVSLSGGQGTKEEPYKVAI